jgi:hypothetical protein
LIKSSVYYRRRHGILRREVRVVYYPVACRWVGRSCYRLYVTLQISVYCYCLMKP